MNPELSLRLKQPTSIILELSSLRRVGGWRGHDQMMTELNHHVDFYVSSTGIDCAHLLVAAHYGR